MSSSGSSNPSAKTTQKKFVKKPLKLIKRNLEEKNSMDAKSSDSTLAEGAKLLTKRTARALSESNATTTGSTNARKSSIGDAQSTKSGVSSLFTGKDKKDRIKKQREHKYN